MNKLKIFNDPVYGFITIPYPIVFDLLSHPWFQRLRRIKQLGLSDFVYPGALHTRFHHALGALHLMHQAIIVLRAKGVKISKEEGEAVCIAILLHDIGHSPFSHALENVFIDASHEQISIWFIEILNEQFNGRLTLALSIFSNQYEKKFLHQLVSSQLDMDRLDYLMRDSFFTGVAEGIVGYDRIIKMLHVVDDELVVEAKGIHSVERFLMSRHFMYWQVYLHKTVIAAEQMLKKFMKLVQLQYQDLADGPLKILLQETNFEKREFIRSFARIDDYDIISTIKKSYQHQNQLINFLSTGLLERRLLKSEFSQEPISVTKKTNIVDKLRMKYPDFVDVDETILVGVERNSSYKEGLDGIKILTKDGAIKPLVEVSNHLRLDQESLIYYVCYPELDN